MAGTNNSWNNQIAGSYNQIILNAGTNGVAISTDASAATVDIATGAAVKMVTLGSTNTTSSTAIKSGSGNIVNNTGLTIDSTGRNFNTKQPCFFATLTATSSNVTGAGSDYVISYDTQVVDQGNLFDGTNFTPSVTGNYLLIYQLQLSGLLVANSFAFAQIRVTGASAQTYQVDQMNPFTNGDNGNGIYKRIYTVLAPMTAGDNATVSVRVFGGAADTIDLQGITDTGGVANSFSGYLLC